MKAIYVSLLCLTQISTLHAAQLTLSANDQKKLSVTLYSDNLGLVQDTRALGTINANDQIVVTDVSNQMQPQSLQIHNAGTILEQTLNSSIISYQSLLNSYIGKSITLIKQSNSNSEETRQQVKLLNVSNQMAIVEVDNEIQTIPINSERWRFIFPSRPKNMLLKPSLTFKSTGKKGSSDVRLSYLTQGLAWQMDYVFELNAARDKLRLKGLASLFNHTDVTYKNANIRLLAGDIAQPSTPVRAMLMSKTMAEESDSINQSRESIGDFHLYKLDNQATLYSQQQTQVPLLEASSIPVKVRYRYQFYVSPNIESQVVTLKPASFLNFKNEKKSGLGKPLPAGKARLFNPDNNGDLQFIGTSSIAHTSTGDSVELPMGKAFDFTLIKQQTSFQKTFNGAIVSMKFNLRNNSYHTKTLDLTSIFSNRWEIISSSYPLSNKNAGAATWSIDVIGNSETVFTLTARLLTKN